MPHSPLFACGNKGDSGEQTRKELGIAMYSIDMSCEDNLYTVIGGALHWQFWFGRGLHFHLTPQLLGKNDNSKTTIAILAGKPHDVESSFPRPTETRTTTPQLHKIILLFSSFLSHDTSAWSSRII